MRPVKNAEVLFGRTASLEHGDISRDLYKKPQSSS